MDSDSCCAAAFGAGRSIAGRSIAANAATDANGTSPAPAPPPGATFEFSLEQVTWPTTFRRGRATLTVTNEQFEFLPSGRRSKPFQLSRGQLAVRHVRGSRVELAYERSETDGQFVGPAWMSSKEEALRLVASVGNEEKLACEREVDDWLRDTHRFQVPKAVIDFVVLCLLALTFTATFRPLRDAMEVAFVGLGDGGWWRVPIASLRLGEINWDVGGAYWATGDIIATSIAVAALLFLTLRLYGVLLVGGVVALAAILYATILLTFTSWNMDPNINATGMLAALGGLFVYAIRRRSVAVPARLIDPHRGYLKRLVIALLTLKIFEYFFAFIQTHRRFWPPVIPELVGLLAAMGLGYGAAACMSAKTRPKLRWATRRTRLRHA